MIISKLLAEEVLSVAMSTGADFAEIYAEEARRSSISMVNGRVESALGGMDYGDRTPTEEEARGMAQQMVSFCVDFEAITEELKREIQEYVKTHTAPYKYPRIVEFRTELPKTTSGKIIRKKL